MRTAYDMAWDVPPRRPKPSVPILDYGAPTYPISSLWTISKKGNPVLFGDNYLACVYKSRYDEYYLFSIIGKDDDINRPAFYKEIFLSPSDAQPHAEAALQATENWNYRRLMESRRERY